MQHLPESSLLLHLLVCAVVLAAGGSNQTTPFPVVPQQPAGKPPALDGDLYDDYQLQEAGYHAGVYAGAAGQFNPYAAGYHQEYDDDYVMPADTTARLLAECEGKENGAPLNKSRACEVRISGADTVVVNLAGGIDGVYRPVACNDGRPMYLRQGSPPHEDRVLWWSNKFSDWDLANGSRPQEDLLMFGGSAAEVRPQHVLSWHLATEFQGNASAAQDYSPANVTVACTNATAAVPSGRPVVVPSKGAKQQKEGGKAAPAAAAGTAPGLQASAPTLGGPQPGQGVAQQPAQNTSAAAASEEKQPEQGEQQQQQQQQQGTARDSGGSGGEPAPPAGVPSGGGGDDWPGDLDDYADVQAPGGAGWHEALSAEAAAAAAAQELKGPLLTDEEIEQQYSLVYKRAAAARAQSAAADSVLAGVFLLGAVGIAVGLPALAYARRRRARNGGAHPEGAAVYISLSQAVRGRRGAKAVQQE